MHGDQSHSLNLLLVLRLHLLKALFLNIQLQQYDFLQTIFQRTFLLFKLPDSLGCSNQALIQKYFIKCHFTKLFNLFILKAYFSYQIFLLKYVLLPIFSQNYQIFSKFPNFNFKSVKVNLFINLLQELFIYYFKLLYPMQLFIISFLNHFEYLLEISDLNQLSHQKTPPIRISSCQEFCNFCYFY